jgi:hypothetical protein
MCRELALGRLAEPQQSLPTHQQSSMPSSASFNSLGGLSTSREALVNISDSTEIGEFDGYDLEKAESPMY